MFHLLELVAPEDPPDIPSMTTSLLPKTGRHPGVTERKVFEGDVFVAVERGDRLFGGGDQEPVRLRVADAISFFDDLVPVCMGETVGLRVADAISFFDDFVPVWGEKRSASGSRTPLVSSTTLYL